MTWFIFVWKHMSMYMLRKYERIYNNVCYVASVQFSRSVMWLFVTPWIAACQASLSITNTWSLLKLMSIELVMPSNHLILCHLLLLRPSIFPNIRVFSNESVLPISWSKYWSFTCSISPSNEYSGQISFRMDWLDLLASVMSNSLRPSGQYPPGSSVMGFSRHEYWSGLPCPYPGDLPDPGIKPASLMSPALAGRFFTSNATWEAYNNGLS